MFKAIDSAKSDSIIVDFALSALILHVHFHPIYLTNHWPVKHNSKLFISHSFLEADVKYASVT